MKRSEKNIELQKCYPHEINKNILCKNETNIEYPFYINYEILLKNCRHKHKHRHNYIDLNLEVNYNLEEILENKDSIKKSFNPNHVNCNKKKEIKNRCYQNEYNIPSNWSTSDSSSYCSDISENSSKNEITKFMNFSQRITYDNDLVDNLNLFDKIINDREEVDKNKKHITCSYLTTQLNDKERGKKRSKLLSSFVSKTGDNSDNNNDNYSDKHNDRHNYWNSNCNNEDAQGEPSSVFNTEKSKQCPIPSNAPCSEERRGSSYLRDQSEGNFTEYNMENSRSVDMKIFKSSNSLCSRKTEEEILNKYEKIIKIMKYLRRIKAKYPEIETTVSILSNHIKNVTFNCEKMFQSRQELNEFLKKIYIYQIFLLKKVVFKIPKTKKDGDFSRCSNNNAPINKMRFISADQQNLRDNTIIPDETSREAIYMLQQLNKNKSFKIPRNILYQNEQNKENEKFNIKREDYNKIRYEKCYGKIDNDVQGITSKKDEKNDSPNRSEEYTMYETYAGRSGGSNHKYDGSKVVNEKIPKKDTYQGDIKKNENNYKNRFNSYNTEDVETACSHYADAQDNYEEALKNNMYKIEKNIISMTKKQGQKKNEHILNVNDELNEIIINHKSDRTDVLHKNKTLPVNTKTNLYNDFGKRKNIPFNKYLNKYESNKGNLRESYNLNSRDNISNLTHKERDTLSDAFKNDYLNVIDKKTKKETKKFLLKDDLKFNALNLESDDIAIRKNMSKNERISNDCPDNVKNSKKTLVLYYDINKELNVISNRDSVIQALKQTLLNKPQNFTALQNFLFKIDVELVEYKNFILLITKNIKKPHLEALYGLNDFSVFEKVYGKKVAPRYLVSRKVKIFYKYDIFYQSFKELENARGFSGITDAVELI
ncbi:CKK domain-containing protein [Plasmodium brasilianum]|uniref:CKK domain-containing protein n=1 Tax=Plasmodium brasilianum TaxID=5824 RepID=A0ACB9Y4M0_PLABR|nr:CKK domain-containing protein [Plasmodium brasilianum]